MKLGQQGRSKQRKRSVSKDRSKAKLASHKAFAPLLGLWGGLLGGLVVVVLPGAMVEQAVGGTLLSTWDVLPQPLLALIAALLLGVGLFAVAADMHSRAQRASAGTSLVKAAARRMRPIDPVRDLGSKSLDDPIETMPFATPAWRDADLDATEAKPAQEAAPEPEATPEPAPAPVSDLPPAPVALDLSEFAELPTRNAVWVEELPVAKPSPVEEPAPVAEPVSPPRAPALRAVVSPPEPGTAALARLRAVPPSELSLVEMVERFAGALHEHRATPPSRTLSGADLAAREASLAEALKALAALSGDATVNAALKARDEPLRAALAQLNTPRSMGRGAA